MTFKMGEKVQVGGLIYTALESEWKPLLGTIMTPKGPGNRFLIIRMNITNSAGEQRHAPLLSIVTDKEKNDEVMELAEGVELPNWLGILRTLAPAATDDGMIVFEARPGNYLLKVNDGGEPGQEKIAYIEIPLSMGPEGLPQAPAKDTVLQPQSPIPGAPK